MDSLIEAAELLKNQADIIFILVGGGREKENLANQASLLSNVIFIDPINKTQVQAMLAYFDVCFIGLTKDPLFRFGVSPNKLFDYIAIGRDILFGKEISNDISDVISDFKFTQELGFIRLRNDQSARSLFTTTYSEKYSIEFISDCIINEVS